MIRAWRIVKTRHASDAFTGEGARRYGGRWNSRGVAVVYTAGSAALAALEMLVHLDAHEILRRYVLVDVTFPESLVEDLDRALLPRNWRADPAPLALRTLGDQWAKLALSSARAVRPPEGSRTYEFALWQKRQMQS